MLLSGEVLSTGVGRGVQACLRGVHNLPAHMRWVAMVAVYSREQLCPNTAESGSESNTHMLCIYSQNGNPWQGRDVYLHGFLEGMRSVPYA